MDSASDTSDPKRKEFEHKEVLLIVQVVRAKAALHRSEKHLVRAQLDETTALGNLHKCHVVEMQRRFNIAESQLGSIHNSIRRNRGTLCNGSLPKRCCQDSTSSIIINPEPGMHFH